MNRLIRKHKLHFMNVFILMFVFINRETCSYITMSNKNRKITLTPYGCANARVRAVTLSPATTLWIFLAMSFLIMTA